MADASDLDEALRLIATDWGFPDPKLPQHIPPGGYSCSQADP
jgi:hypothetical protein